MGYVAYLGKDQIQGEVFDYDFKNLEEDVRGAAASSDPNVRDEWKDKAFRVIGKFAPSRESQREFGLIRYRISCCASDAMPLTLPILSREDRHYSRRHLGASHGPRGVSQTPRTSCRYRGFGKENCALPTRRQSIHSIDLQISVKK